MTNLATLRDRTESLLKDAGNSLWTTSELDDAIRRALHRYSEMQPRELVTTLTLAAAGREVSLSGVNGLLRPLRVWWPYTASEPEYPPAWVHWDLHGPATLFLDVADEPQANDVVRLFYTALHTIEGLDSAAATTVPADDEETIILGAAGYAALARAAYATEAVTLSGETPARWHAWAEARLAHLEALIRPRYEPARWVVWED
ncbi:MAG: hypothetical protein IT330_17225 [Anaerolineae bacterium]|nr:hypothetical protein [Anaerolineae bacterium]